MARNGGRLHGYGYGLFDPETDDPLAEGDAVVRACVRFWKGDEGWWFLMVDGRVLHSLPSN
jgi:hypothetical protein